MNSDHFPAETPIQPSITDHELRNTIPGNQGLEYLDEMLQQELEDIEEPDDQ